jgi:hypothetical protein
VRGVSGEEIAVVAEEQPLELTEKQRAGWLEKLRADPKIGNKAALAEIGVRASRKQIAVLLADPEFRETYEEARGRHPDQLEAEALRRAVDGVDEPVFHDGEVVGHVRKYSDRLLMAILKARHPAYRERVEHTGADGAPLEVTVRHDHGELLDGLEQIGLIRRGPAAVVDAAAGVGAERPALLPARSD